MLRSKPELKLHSLGESAKELQFMVDSDIYYDTFCEGVNASGHAYGLFRVHHMTHVDIWVESPEEFETLKGMLLDAECHELGIRALHYSHSTENGTLDMLRFTLR